MEVVSKNKKTAAPLRALISFAAAVMLGAVILLGKDKVGIYFNEGIRLAAARVLPTTFPFMVLSSLACAMIDTSSMPGLCSCFRRIFSIGGAGLSALLIGWLAGFPVGAKMTAEIYGRGELSREEAERLIAYSSCASPPFVIAVLGSGMLGDVLLGVILLLSVYLGTVITAQLFRDNWQIFEKPTETSGQKYNFVDSVKSAAISSIYMSAFVSLFYIISKGAADMMKSPLSEALLSLFLEVTGAVVSVADSGFSLIPKMGLLGFALGFGGLSVMAQTSAAIEDTDLSMRQYPTLKLSVGLVSAILAMGLAAVYSAIR